LTGPALRQLDIYNPGVRGDISQSEAHALGEPRNSYRCRDFAQAAGCGPLHFPCLRLDERVLAEMQRRVYSACRLHKSRPKLHKVGLIVRFRWSSYLIVQFRTEWPGSGNYLAKRLP
jgi:hypothetical protein